MRRASTAVMLIIIIFLVAASIIIGCENNRLRERMDSVKHTLPFTQIQWDLVQLEGAIAYQIENQWVQPSHVREKIGDVLQDVMVILEVNDGIGVLSEQEKAYLDHLYQSLTAYPNDNMVEPINELSQSEIDKLIQLRKALRDVEWGIGFSNRGDWDPFLGKLTRLLPQI